MKVKLFVLALTMCFAIAAKAQSSNGANTQHQVTETATLNTSSANSPGEVIINASDQPSNLASQPSNKQIPSKNEKKQNVKDKLKPWQYVVIGVVVVVTVIFAVIAPNGWNSRTGI